MKNTFLILAKGWFLAFCFLGTVKSQQVIYSAELPEITKSGFYRIVMSPDFLSKTGNKFNRIRIYDGKNEVPYLVKRDALSATTASFHPLPILKKIRKDSLESVVFGNPDSTRLTNVHILLKRAWTAKKIKVSGSSDGKTWYIVRSEFVLDLAQSVGDNNKTEISYTLDLPLTDYTFYKIESFNRDDSGINILSIGYYLDNKTTGSLMLLPSAKIELVKKPDPLSDLFRVTFNEPYVVSRLMFKISQPRLFHRNARLYTHNPLKAKNTKKKSDEFPPGSFNHFILSSKDSINAVELDDVYTRSFFLLVENQDNPSLGIKSIQGYYHPYYIKTYLESGINYVLNIGSDSLAFPAYDLSNFDSSTGDQIEMLSLKTFIQQKIPIVHTQRSFFKSRIWLGLGLLFVAGILAYVCFAMINEIKK